MSWFAQRMMAIDHEALSTERRAVFEAMEQLKELDVLRPLDVALVETLDELSGGAASAIALWLVALTSYQAGRGHVCLSLASVVEQAPATPEGQPLLRAEDGLHRLLAAQGGDPLEQCVQALCQCPFVSSDASESCPLFFDESHRLLYLQRFRRAEATIAGNIVARLRASLAGADPVSANAATQFALSTLFGQAPEDEVDDQRLAAAVALRSRFSIITGGPGTGKTTTVVKLLAAVQHLAIQAGRAKHIALAAPTGKAAARLNESIRRAASELPMAELALQPGDIPTTVTTIHRLLGVTRASAGFRHNADFLLPVDVLVIDEASMVDMELLASVFEALAEDAHIILIGDKDQLASVDAGSVLGDLCANAEAGGYSQATADWLKDVTGQTVPAKLSAADGSLLDQAVAMLRKNYRFKDDSGIARLALEANRGTLANVASRFEHADDVDLILSPEGPQEVLKALVLPGEGGYRDYLEALRRRPAHHAPQAEWDAFGRRVLATFDRFQLLCAVRQGDWGVEAINEWVADILSHSGLIADRQGWYEGRPVLITANDYTLDLMNGDIGITMAVPELDPETGDTTEVLRVAFPASDASSAVRWIAPSRLQKHETVYAMTVHKSQGSEFHHACLLLPEQDSPVLTRELIYTGITRAAARLSLVMGSTEVLERAAEKRVERASGLLDAIQSRLGEGAGQARDPAETTKEPVYKGRSD